MGQVAIGIIQTRIGKVGAIATRTETAPTIITSKIMRPRNKREGAITIRTLAMEEIMNRIRTKTKTICIQTKIDREAEIRIKIKMPV